MDFELTYYDVAVHHDGNYGAGIHPLCLAVKESRLLYVHILHFLCNCYGRFGGGWGYSPIKLK